MALNVLIICVCLVEIVIYFSGWIRKKRKGFQVTHTS